MTQSTTVHLTPDDKHTRPGMYAEFVATLRQEPLRTQWWNDAESEHEDGVSYIVALAPSRSGLMIPAAWAGYMIRPDATLKCCNNYVVHGFRDGYHRVDLYARAYRVRHRDVVLRLGLPAETFLFARPIALHEADGWVRDRSPEGSGWSHPFLGGPTHSWQRLTWSPPAASQTGTNRQKKGN